MNIQKRQSIQKILINQAGSQRLILNDLVLGFQGAKIVSELIPQYHSNLEHIQIKGNNINSEGFQIIGAALAHCLNLKSIEAEWNFIGSGPDGFEVLCHLVKNLPYLQFIDLKNNRISHQLAQYICQMIQINSQSLKVIDLRWNQLGEIGAQAIYQALAHNSGLKYLGLADNRISLKSLNQIQAMMKNVTRGTASVLPKQTKNSQIGWSIQIPQNTFPISQNAYPSMQLQTLNAQTRSKIENQQSEAEIYHNKLKIQIDKTLQKMKAIGLQTHEMKLRYDSISNENLTLLNQLRQAQRLLCLQKQRHIGVDKGLISQKNSIKVDKNNINIKIQSLMQKSMQKHQKQVQQLQMVMNQNLIKLQNYYRQKINKKRSNRDKLTEIKQDIIKIQIAKETSWDKITDIYQNTHKNTLQDKYRSLEEIVAQVQFQLKSQLKKSQHLSEKLTSIVLKGLEKEAKIENQIFYTQNSIKEKHNEMGTTNVQIEKNHFCSALLESKLIDKEAGVEMRRKYIKYIQSQSSINAQIQRLKQEQDIKSERLLSQALEMRIADLEKAIRVEQTQNKMIRNHYDRLISQLQNVSKKSIQSVLYEV